MWLFTLRRDGTIDKPTKYILRADKSILTELIFIKSKQTPIANFHFSPPNPGGKRYGG